MGSHTGADHPLRRGGSAAVLGCIAVAAILPARASAQAHVIGPGHEATVLELFAPHTLGAEVEGGFALWGVAIEPTRIAVTLRRADGTEAQIFLQHPDDSPGGAPTSANFALVRDPDAPAAATGALDAIAASVQRNDAGNFWDHAAATIEEPRSASGAPSLRRAMLWGEAEWVPIDGIAVILLIFVLGILLAIRLLVDEPRWMVAALAGSVASGALVRLYLAPATFLGAWPWSRLYPNARAVAHGEWLAAIAERTGDTYFLTDVTMWTNFAYAAAMPLVIFAHATYLLRDPRAGLFASFAIAFLPQHIRYSRCEDGFVGSLVLTSLAFALIHGWLRDPSRVVRGLLLCALPIVLYPGYLLRPLNILFIVVYAGALVTLHGETAPRWRRGVGLMVVLGVGAAALVQFLGRNAETASATVGPRILLEAVRVLVTPSLLVLSDPRSTPPALMLLAVLGGVVAWRKGERRLVGFLVLWLLLFEVAHAVVVQPSMQARYHLHLVVPFLLLGALAVVHADPRWLADRRWRIAAGVAAASVVLGPWLHGAFIADVGYTELGEYEFVRDARDLVPADCTVIEFVGGEPGVQGAGVRFERIGALASPHRESRFHVVAVHRGGLTADGAPTLEELSASPPACLYLYEGLACETAAGTGPDRHACAALRDRFHTESVRSASVPVRLYDSASDLDHALDGARAVELRLSRAPPR